MTIEDAIFSAYCETHRCVGMAGPALSARFSLAMSCGGTVFPEKRLREWAAVMIRAAEIVEGKQKA